jgi:hypothetical protein
VGKGLFQAIGENFNQVVGQELEIIPQNNPFKLKPLAGVGAEIGDGKTKMKEEDIPRYQTDHDGIAELPIRPRGLAIDRN